MEIVNLIWGTWSRFFILFFLIFCNQSCKNESIEINKIIGEKKEGIYINESEDGIITIEFYKDNKLDGVGIEINKKNKTLMTIAYYRDSLFHGSNYLFYPSGKIEGIREWENGKKIGFGYDLFENQKTKSYKEFDKNGYVNLQKDYDSLGNITNEIDRR